MGDAIRSLYSRKRSSGRVPRRDYTNLLALGAELAQDEPHGKEQGMLGNSQGAQNTASRKGRRRERVLVDRNATTEAEEEPENEYEQQRLARIKRNTAFIQQLELKRLADELVDSFRTAPPVAHRPPQTAQRRKLAPAPQQSQIRKSSRQRGLEPAKENELLEDTEASASHPLRESTQLMELEEYFRRRGETVDGHRVTGSFEGWVNPQVCERYGIAEDASAAWESQGGGKFSFKIDKKAIPSNLKSRGWSDARAFSSTQLQKNPNAYFYRHVAPHEQQAQGEWSDEEHALFLDTVKKFGVGDKWGLFSSYIPQRVGYQCSAYYREVIIPQGFVFDAKFRMTGNGRAVYVG